MKEIKVLDKGYVKYIRHMGDDVAPVEDARMSTNNPTGVDIKKDDGLREYLWSEQHTTPSEGCGLTLELKLPLSTLRQLDRHRTLDITNMEISDYDDFRKYTSRNEFSGRYAEFSDDFYYPSMDRIGGQSSTNKQGTSGELPTEVKDTYSEELIFASSDAYGAYQRLLRDGISKELARFILPSNIYTKIRITSNLLNWFKMLKLRLDEHAQYEIRVYAEAIASIIKSLWPKSYEIFEEHTLYAVNLSRSESKALLGILNRFEEISQVVYPQLSAPSDMVESMLGKKKSDKLKAKFKGIK